MSTYTITLPSRGQIYKDKDGNPAIPDGLVTMGPLRMKEQAIFANRASDNTKKLDEVLKRVIISPTIDPSTLLVSDRLYLLFALRINTIGPEYQVPFRCEHCDAQQRFTLDLIKDLTVKNARLDPSEDAKVFDAMTDLLDPSVPYMTETFDVALPNGVTITARLLNGNDENAIASYQKRIRTQISAASDPSIFYRMALMITQVNGKDIPITDKIHMVEDWDLRTSNAFSDAIEAREPGIDLTLRRDCVHCGAGNEFPVAFTAEFFRPRTR